jgi:hypothetical protein
VGPGWQREGELEESNRVRGSAQGKGKWAEPEGIGRFLFIQINFKLFRTILSKRKTYQAPKILNKIWMERV